MAEITATYIDSGQWAEELVVRGTESRGRKCFLVNTRRRSVALSSEGLPAVGDSWDEVLPALRAIGYDNALWAGGKDGSEGVDGHLIIPVEYETPNWSGAQRELVGTNYTQVETEKASVKVYFPPNLPPGVQIPPISNGEGTEKEVGLSKFRCHLFVSPDDVTSAYLAMLIDFNARQVVNSFPVTLPSIEGTDVEFQAPTGSARFLDFSIQEARNKVKIIVVLGLSPDHLFRWKPTTKEGRSAGEAQATEIYEAADLAPVFNP